MDFVIPPLPSFPVAQKPHSPYLSPMKTQGKAYLYAGAAVLMWSTVATVFKLALERMGFLQLLLYSSVVSTATLFAITLARRKLPQLRRFGWRDFGSSALMGLLNPFLYYIVLFKSYSLLPAQIAQPLNYSWGIVLVVFSAIFLRQKIGWRGYISIIVGFCGVILIATGGSFASIQYDPLGVALGLGSALLWASYWILNIRSKSDPVVKLAVNFAFGTIFIITLVAITGANFRVPAEALGAAVYVGFFEMGATFVFWLMALKLSENSAKVANLIYLSPFLSLIFIRRILGEDIRITTIIGLVLIVAGIVISKARRRTYRK